MVSTFIIIGLAVGGKYFYDYVNRPLEAVVYGSAEELKSELERLEAVNETGRISWRDRYKLGVSYHQSMRYKDAVVALEDFIKVRPEVGKAYETIGMSYYRLNELEKAVENWKLAQTVPGVSSSSSASIGLMISDVERTIALRSRIQKLETVIGESKTTKGDSDEWGQKFELALLYIGDKKPEKALVHLEELSLIRKDDADIHATLAQVYANTGDITKAYDSMKKASKLLPDDEDLKSRLVELGRLKKALKDGEYHKQSPSGEN